MTNSNDPKNSGFEQSNDLIAELARIVADDAKRSTVSDAIDERAQATAAARTMPTAKQSFEPNPKFEARPELPRSEPAFRPTLVEAKEQVPENTVVAPTPAAEKPVAPFSTIGEGVTPLARREPVAPVGQSSSNQIADVPFEFDFTSNIEQGFAEQPPLMPQRRETPERDVEPVAGSELPNEPGDLDAIASLIEDVERQSAPELAPKFDEIPVAQSGFGSRQQNEPRSEAQDFDQTQSQVAPTLRGEDEFAVSPSSTAAVVKDTSSAVNDPLSEIENLIADTRTKVEPDRNDATPADAAEAAIFAALAAAGTRKVSHSTQRPEPNVAVPVGEQIVHSDTPIAAEQFHNTTSVGTDEIRNDGTT
ncbi:MAG: hypothetical protein V3V10_10425, partial [Planctomycetota bacterium]